MERKIKKGRQSTRRLISCIPRLQEAVNKHFPSAKASSIDSWPPFTSVSSEDPIGGSRWVFSPRRSQTARCISSCNLPGAIFLGQSSTDLARPIHVPLTLRARQRKGAARPSNRTEPRGRWDVSSRIWESFCDPNRRRRVGPSIPREKAYNRRISLWIEPGGSAALDRHPGLEGAFFSTDLELSNQKSIYSRRN